MFNLLVQNDPNNNSAWNESSRFELERTRLFEYTVDQVASMYRNDIQSLKELPCLFSYEGFNGSGRVGDISSIGESRKYLEIVYNLDARFPPVPIDDEETYRLFGCSGWECNRTHWAVKEINLYEVVAELLAKQHPRVGPGVDERAVLDLWGDDSQRRYRIFLSHRAQDKKAAAKVAEGLEERGHCTFVAHNDIRPTRQWRDEILGALATMTHFLALITENFHDGSWTDQEIGYAFCRPDVRRIFIKLADVDPKGLAGFEQAVSAHNVESALDQIRPLLDGGP